LSGHKQKCIDSFQSAPFSNFGGAGDGRGPYKAAALGHARPQGARPHVEPPKQRITLPVPVQERALRRQRKPKNLRAAMDREQLKDKPLVISTRRKELNQRKGQTYGRLETLPLVSAGWHHRKSIGDHFTIQPIMGNKATNFGKKNQSGKEVGKEKQGVGGGGRQPTFADYGLDPALVSALSRCGFTKSTNIQHEAIPSLLEYSDCHALIASETGNGKTLAMAVPIIQAVLALKAKEDEIRKMSQVSEMKISKEESRPLGKVAVNSPYAVIVTPGRELADQIGALLKSVCAQVEVRVHVFKGGNIERQVADGPRVPMDIVVGTLGGLKKLFDERYLRKNRVAEVGIDEVDTMLDDTFRDETLLFLQQFGRSGAGRSVSSGLRVTMAGATFPTNFDSNISEVMNPEEMLKVSTDQIHRVMFHVPQKFLRVAPTKKTEALLEALEKDISKGNKVVIFSNKSSTAYFVQMFLKENNIACVGFSQREHFIQRRKNLDQFLMGEVKVISSTDLMSRGLDTHDVSHVINFDFPLNPSDYIHRAGRVGRVGGCQGGRVTSFVDNQGGVKVVQNLETAVRKNIEIQQVNSNIIRIIKFRRERWERTQGLQ